MEYSNSFQGGLNRDTSRSKNSPTNYYYLLNGKVITETGLTTGSVTNERGNTLLFKIPDTAPVYEIIVPENYSAPSQLSIVTSTNSFLVPLVTDTLQDIYTEITSNSSVETSITNLDFNVFLNGGRIIIVGLDDLTSITLTFGTLSITNVVPALTDLKICGWGTLEDKVIVFTTDNTEDEPEGEAGQIWELEFDEETDTIQGLSSNFLVPSTHLKYNNLLNLSIANRVGEVIGRYENSKIRGIYFTDFYNNLRGFNLANPEGLGLHPSDLDVRADVSLSEPIITSIGNGSIPVGSVVQYGYRLKTVNGSSSIISKLSPPIPLADDPSSGNYEDFKGKGFNTSNSRSVTYTISDIDTSYSIIEHIVIIYEQLDVPQIYNFKEELVPSSGQLTVTHTGTEHYLTITLEELNLLSSPFVCKTITSKRNKLIPANIKYKKTLLDFDARAYRFNGSGVCRLYDKQGDFADYGSIAALTGLISTADAINPYNDESGTVYGTIPSNTPVTWETDFQYKYKSDGATLGGEGVNVSYEFTTTETTAYSNTVSSAAPFNSVGRNTITIYTGTGDTITNNNYFSDFKSPLISTYLKGYKRGETYRWGITFFDKKGNPTLVHWIGDIRFPEADEYENFGSGTVSALATKQIGITFTIDISSIQTEISGFSFVRVQRTEEDKTRLGTGIPIGLPNNTLDQFTQMDGLFGNPVDEETELNGTAETNILFLQDFPGNIPTYNSRLFGVLLPFHQYDSTFIYKSGDYLKTVGYYNTQAYCTYYNAAGDNTIGVYHRGYAYQPPTTVQRFQINYQETLLYKTTTDADNFLSGNNNTIINASYSRSSTITDNKTPLGIGNKKLILTIEDTPSTGFDSDMSIWEYGGQFQGGTTAPSAGATFGTTYYQKIVDYCRFPVNQYGGASYESRASQTYISTGHFTFVDNSTSSVLSSDVYGGDIFTTYYSDEYITMHWEASANSAPFNPEPTNNKLSVAVGFPCETHINFNLRHGNTWSDDQDYSGNWTSTSYSYNRVYHQEEISIQQYVSPAIIDTSTEEHPHAILVSEEKFDGEAFDAWRIYPSNNFLEVDGVHGDINKIITFKDKVVFYQTRAIGQVSVQDRSITQDQSGVEVVLGTGQVLDYYGYITTDYGCFHQFSVIKTPNALYNFDTLGKKVIQLRDQENPISDIKGLSAYFSELLTGKLRENDQTIWYNDGIISNGNPAVGIHGVYDKRNSRVIWTIQDGTVSEVFDKEGIADRTWIPSDITITFNELMNSFESFKSFTPRLYLQADSRLLSTDPSNLGHSYLHNVGNRGTFYGTVYPTSITILINSAPEEVKTLDVIEYLMDLKTSAGVDIPLETFNTLRIYNSYQDTGTITLTPQTNIIRTLRKWRMNVLRDNTTNKPRLRDYHFFLELTYNNNSNKEMVLHDVSHHIRPSNF